MQVNLNCNCPKPQQNFGMAIKYHPQDKRIANYINALSPNVKTEIKELEAKNANNPINVFLSVINKYGKKRLQAEVGYKTFTEGYFAKNPLKTIKKGSKFAEKLNKEQTLQNELWNHNSPQYIDLSKK